MEQKIEDAMKQSIQSKMEVVSIPMKEIDADSDFNCRGIIAPIDVVDLVHDIEKRGLISPVVVIPCTTNPDKKYRLIAGFRRYTAHRVMARTQIEAIIRPDMSDELDALCFNLAENLKRSDLTPFQEAMALKKILQHGDTEEGVARRVGMSRGWVQIRMLILKLDPIIQKEIAVGAIKQEHIRQLYTIQRRQGNDKAIETVKQIKIAEERKGAIKAIQKEGNKNIDQKKARKRSEILRMMEIIQDQIGNGMFTKCLAWAAGEVSDLELDQALAAFATSINKTYVIRDLFIPPEMAVVGKNGKPLNYDEVEEEEEDATSTDN